MSSKLKAPVKQALLFFLPITQLILLWVVSRILPYDLSSIIWVVALFVFGMAHGSMDIVIIKKYDKNQTLFDTGKKLGWYLLLMLASGFGLMMFPLVTVLSFFTLTAIHFGEADLTSFSDFFSKSPELPKSWAWLKGSLVIALPCYFYPREAWEPFGSITAIPSSESVDLILKTFSLSLLSLFFFICCNKFSKMQKTNCFLWILILLFGVHNSNILVSLHSSTASHRRIFSLYARNSSYAEIDVSFLFK